MSSSALKDIKKIRNLALISFAAIAAGIGSVIVCDSVVKSTHKDIYSGLDNVVQPIRDSDGTPLILSPAIAKSQIDICIPIASKENNFNPKYFTPKQASNYEFYVNVFASRFKNLKLKVTHNNPDAINAIQFRKVGIDVMKTEGILGKTHVTINNNFSTIHYPITIDYVADFMDDELTTTKYDLSKESQYSSFKDSLPSEYVNGSTYTVPLDEKVTNHELGHGLFAADDQRDENGYENNVMYFSVSGKQDVMSEKEVSAYDGIIGKLQTMPDFDIKTKIEASKEITSDIKLDNGRVYSTDFHYDNLACTLKDKLVYHNDCGME
jgi:hypothetical protein